MPVSSVLRDDYNYQPWFQQLLVYCMGLAMVMFVFCHAPLLQKRDNKSARTLMLISVSLHYFNSSRSTFWINLLIDNGFNPRNRKAKTRALAQDDALVWYSQFGYGFRWLDKRLYHKQQTRGLASRVRIATSIFYQHIGNC